MKAQTARIAMFHHLRIPFVFTLEASFCGANRGQLAGKHFSLGNLVEVGKAVLRALWAYKKTLLTKSSNAIKEINAEAEARFTKEKDNDEGSSSEEEALPNKRPKGGKALLTNAMKSSEIKDDKEEKKSTLVNRREGSPLRKQHIMRSHGVPGTAGPNNDKQGN